MKKLITRNIKRLSAILISVAMSLGMCASYPVFAESITDELSEGIVTLDANPTNNETTLPYKASLPEIYAGLGTYTRYNFKTTTGKLVFDYSLYAASPLTGHRALEIVVYKPIKILFFTEWVPVENASYIVEFDDTVEEEALNKPCTGKVTISGLDTNTVYCVRFNNITPANSSSALHNSIFGTVNITES